MVWNHGGLISPNQCRNCGKMEVYRLMTPIGELGFCSETCFAIYMDLPVKEEGYYGLPKAEHSNKE